MKPLRELPLVLLAALLTACGASDRPAAPEAQDEAADDIGEPLHQSLDRARSVEELGGARLGTLDEAIDDAGD